MKEIWRLLTAEEFDRCRDEIRQENRLAIRLLCRVGVLLSVANIFAQVVVIGTGALAAKNLWLPLYFVLLMVLVDDRLPQRSPYSTLILYLIEAPPMVMSVLLGTIWDPTHQAVTFLMFLMALPVFIMDRPLRLVGVFTGWTLLFTGMCRVSKSPELFQVDVFHAVEFYLAMVSITFVVVSIRLESLRSAERIRYHLEHDSLTGMLNRNALLRRLDRYLGKPLFVVLGDLDQLTLYNDFYGHEVGDEMLCSFSQAILSAFGEADTYRFGGDEMLGIAVGASEEQQPELLDRCRKRLRRNEFNGLIITMTCAFGYVTGTPRDEKEFQEMLQLADIYAHKARHTGRDQTVGGVFDKAHLRAGIVESNITTHARVFETNQLTGLPSMSYFIARADELLHSKADQERKPGVAFVNLIHFRAFNDEFGYAQGDALIRHMAASLRTNFPGRHICYINGSQFGVLCYQNEVEDGLTRVNDELMSYKAEFPIFCKAGFAPYTGSERAIFLMDKAKLAHDSIYEDKDLCCRVYDTRLDEEDKFRQYIVSHVDEAIEKGYLKVYYQPIIRAVTGEVCNEEALSRWEDPKYGFLPPFQFVPLLEEKRLIYKVNLNVLRLVLRDFEIRRANGVPVVPVSINFSRHDFAQTDIVQAVCELVDESGVDHSYIKIEITESALIDNQDLIKRETERFRALGFEVWMDDFGSEYSTLNLLQELNFDLIKIDMQFMKNFSEEGRNVIIVANIIDMARQMGITTLVEGVETEEHLRILRRLGAEKLQGFLFNRPNPLTYIMERNKAGTGLTFERSAESRYYEEVGRIDLNEPLVYDEQNTLQMSNELPAGVLEYRNGAFTCIRGKDRFIHLLSELGMIDKVQRGTEHQPLISPAPEKLLQAAQRCEQAEGWVQFSMASGEEREYTCYLRKVASNVFNDSVALLAVLLTTHKD